MKKPKARVIIPQFVGRVFWLDVIAHHTYDLDATPNGIDRLPMFETFGLIELNDPTVIVVITEREVNRDKTVKGHRDSVDIPRPLVTELQKYMGDDKWEMVNI